MKRIRTIVGAASLLLLTACIENPVTGQPVRPSNDADTLVVATCDEGGDNCADPPPGTVYTSECEMNPWTQGCPNEDPIVGGFPQCPDEEGRSTPCPPPTDPNACEGEEGEPMSCPVPTTTLPPDPECEEGVPICTDPPPGEGS